MPSAPPQIFLMKKFLLEHSTSKTSLLHRLRRFVGLHEDSCVCGHSGHVFGEAFCEGHRVYDGGGGRLSFLLLEEVIDAISRLGMLTVNASDLDLETGPQ